MPSAHRTPRVSRALPALPPLPFTLLCVCVLLGSGVAQAQVTAPQEMPAALMADATLRDYDIAPGALGTALSDFARQSGLLLSFDPEAIRGQTAPALRGRHTPGEGLQRLLANSGLRVVAGASGSYILLPRAVTELAPTMLQASRLAASRQDTYRVPQSSVYLSSEEVERFGRISTGDLLKGVAGVQVGDNRNGGALDVNIRGIQGQSRIAVRVDGAQQALDVYRGYGGTQQRSYIDPELISNVTVNKGPSTTSGAIGGTVDMQTIGVDDILTGDNPVGLRLTGDIWNNGVEPPQRSSRSKDQSLSAVPHDSRGSLSDWEARSGSVAFGYSSERVDVVAAYARRNQGNYFSGKKGQDRYRLYDEYGSERDSVATVYNAGDEVLNSSTQTESYLLKTIWRLADAHTLSLGYLHYDGRTGDVMPSDIFRFGTAGIYQYPLSTVKIDTYTANYRYQPEDNPLLDLSARLWMTDAKTSLLSSAWTVPVSQLFRTDRSWTRQENRRIGAEVGNLSRFETTHGNFNLELGGAFQLEDLQPQKSVLFTQHDINANRMLQDASRQEFSLHGKLEYQPSEPLTLWAGGRYSRFRTQDNTVLSSARREDREVRYLSLRNATGSGSMMWFPDANGQYTDATDPRLNNGIVFGNSNEPDNGIPFDAFGATSVTVYPEEISNVVVGYDHARQRGSNGEGFAPSFGVNIELLPETFLYVSYTQGLRLPSLFETSQGTQQVTPGHNLKPERSHSWEVGASTQRHALLSEHDSAALKLAYFDNDIKHYVNRYYDPTKWGLMRFSNADSYHTRGLELQSHYDAGRFFGDLSATYYLKAETCDATFAAALRASANPYQPTENTPNCTPGSFMGSYTNTQNPPKLSTNLGLGVRLLDETLVLGGRMVYSSGPTETLDKPWQTGATTPQIEYRSVSVFDLFLSYKLFESTELRASLQNLTDRYYLDPLAQSMMPAPGRTMRLGVQAKF